MRKLWILLVLGLLLSGCMGVRPGEHPPKLVLRYADNQPEDYPTTRAARYFADLVYERTQGNIRIRVYANGELGDEISVVQQLQFGGIDLARASMGTLSEYNSQLAVLSLPYLYTDADHMWRVLDGPLGDTFLRSTRKLGIVGLSWYDAGARSFYTREPIRELKDLSGMTIRVQESDIMSRTVELLGASPVQLMYGEVYPALQTAQVDGAENNLPSYVSTGHCQAAPYFLRDEHSRLPEMQIMSTIALDKITAVDPDYMTIIMACAKESALYERQLWKEQVSASEQEALRLGCTITQPDEEVLAQFRSAVLPLYDSLPEDTRNIVRSIRMQ